jgi:signal peptidase II
LRIWYYAVAVMVFVADQATKWAAHVYLESSPSITIIPEYLRLSYLHNSGVAFGFFNSVESEWKPYALAAMAVVALAIIVVYGMRMPAGRILMQTALAVTSGGILGNLLDRVLRGYVIDFIEFHIHDSFYWPTFNVADSAITIGIGLLLIDAVRHPEKEREQSAENKA